MARGVKQLIFFVSLFLTLLVLCRGSTIGVCYGRNADDLPTPDKVAQLVQQHKIKYLRIYDSNIQVLKAFANTGVELMIGITNSDLLPFSQFQSNVDTWLRNSILPYYPAARITCITVGAEVTESPGNASALVVPAMHNVLVALKKVGLHKKIKVSSTHSLGVLDSPNNVSLDYALFESSSEVIDPNTGLLYTNMFDAQIDAIYFALMALNFRTIKVMVTETGWPSKGSSKEKAATPDNAQTYNTNLIRHVINNSGTPAKLGEELDIYIFSLFNENRKPGIESERNWGLFYPDQTSVYNLDFSGKGNAIDWACGSGNVDCSAIQPSQPCFEPDTLVSHASYAFNSYYQQNGATDVACSFGGTGVKVDKDPSYDNCMYMITGTNKTAASNTTAIAATSSSAQNEAYAWISSFLLMTSIVYFFI
ncbi:GLUCAN ENDO-13-BETA-GLUCOSIDASE 13 [Salix koriyanagi]|uniref:glucan endo-1,3-beta-D-glucosidase n=1 Tax=Salix koriyanagi TaxID=2511006 RepID=A0A9Q0W3K4_9ROSI|nr:GLUCAN ENDO-13-BETA-GLUCOSIDASE 13 [Salix koriyanagi]